jgi:hypothetical protein
MKLRSWFATAALAAAMGSVSAGCASNAKHARDKHGEQEEANEKKVAFASTPAPVQQTLTAEAKGNKIDTVDQEDEDGKTIYEADVVIGGKNYEIKVAPDGSLVSKKLDTEDNEKNGKNEKEGDEKDEEHEHHEKK